MISSLYSIKHPLRSVHNLPLAAVAAFTDNDVEEYCREYDKYAKAQKESVELISSKIDEARKLMREIFDTDTSYSKQVKYFDREIRKGNTCVDQHSLGIPHKSDVILAVQNARSVVGATSKSHIESVPPSEEQLADQERAVKFLESKGYKCGVDFSQHNAVTIATALVHNNLALYTHKHKDGASGNVPGMSNFPREYYLKVVGDDRLIDAASNHLYYCINGGTFGIAIRRSPKHTYDSTAPYNVLIDTVILPATQYCRNFKIEFHDVDLRPIIVLNPHN